MRSNSQIIKEHNVDDTCVEHLAVRLRSGAAKLRDFSVKSSQYYRVKQGVNIPSSLRSSIEKIAEQFFKKTGVKIIVSSGYRVPSEQALLMFRWKKKTGRKLTSFYKNYEAAQQLLGTRIVR